MQQAAETTSTLAANPDRELLMACAMFTGLQRRMNAIDFGPEPPGGWPSDSYDEQVRIHDEQIALAEQMVEARPKTLGGHVARAHALAEWPQELLGDGSAAEIVPPLISAIVRDLIAFGGSAVA